MAKQVDQAAKAEKLAKLEKELAGLQKQLAETSDKRKQKKLAEKIEQKQGKIKQVKTGERMSRQTKRDLIAYSFLAPNFIGFAVFTLIPIVFAFVLAFSNWDGNNPITFAGLDNFIRAFHNDRFLASLKNTIIYCIGTVPLTLAAASWSGSDPESESKRKKLLPYRQLFPVCSISGSGSSGVEYVVQPAKKRPGQYDLISSGSSCQRPSEMGSRSGLGHVYRCAVQRMEEHGILYGDLSCRSSGHQC